MEAQVQSKTLQHCVTFNGIINSELFEAGEGYTAFYINGKNKEEFPLVVIEISLKDAKERLEKGSEISGFGFLNKINNDWVVICKQLSISSEEEKDGKV